MRVYFAGPLFSEAELTFNENLTHALEERGFSVFLPQRDGVEKDKEQYASMSHEELSRAIFEIDRDEVWKADILLFVLDGRVPDEGAALELGLAYAHKTFKNPQKRLIGLMTDVRVAFAFSKLNPMLGVPLEYVARSREELFAYLEKENPQ